MRASLNPDKARTGGGGVEAGNYLVTAACFSILKSDYKSEQLHQVLTCVPLDADGDEVRGADTVEIRLGFGEKSHDIFFPGAGAGPDDIDPKLAGKEPDTEGNTIYCEKEEQFNASCSAIVFQKTLAAAGFPKEILDRCWAPDYVGLKFALATLTPKDVNARFGTRLNTKPVIDKETKQPAEITYKVVDRWLNPAYLSTSTAAGSAGNVATQSATAPTSDNVEDITKEVLALIAGTRKGAKQAVKTKQSLLGFFTQKFTASKKPANLLSKAHEFIKNDEWVVNALIEAGGTPGYNSEGMWDGSVVFPE